MPTRSSRGPAPQPWRPRKIEQDYLDVSEGMHLPRGRESILKALHKWEAFLREHRIDSDAVTIHDLITWEHELVATGFSRGRMTAITHVRSYYLLKGSSEPDSKWSKLAAEIRVHRLPRVIGKVEPYKALPLELLPKILEAARRVKQYRLSPSASGKLEFGGEVYSEAFAVVATFLYTGGRAQWYGINEAQVEFALGNKYVEIYVKAGAHVYVPIHDRLLAIWKEHLDKRDFDGPAFFRHGRDPYTYQEGSKDWREDARNAHVNNWHVQRIFHPSNTKQREEKVDCVERRLEELYGIRETLTSHRIRKSVGTYMESYGFTESERRLQLSHGAKTITQSYSVPAIRDVQRKISSMDLGDAKWVADHNPPSNLFGNGNGENEELLAENRELRKRIDELLARIPKVVA